MLVKEGNWAEGYIRKVEIVKKAPSIARQVHSQGQRRELGEKGRMLKMKEARQWWKSGIAASGSEETRRQMSL